MVLIASTLEWSRPGPCEKREEQSSGVSPKRVCPRLGLSPTSEGPTWLVFPSISREAPGGTALAGL